MAERFTIPADFTPAQTQIAMAAFYFCLEHMLGHVLEAEGAPSAQALKRELVTALKNGDIDMSILDDASTFDFVVPMIERLVAVKAAA